MSQCGYYGDFKILHKEFSKNWGLGILDCSHEYNAARNFIGNIENVQELIDLNEIQTGLPLEVIALSENPKNSNEE